jgi:hypothetical protein
VTCQTVFHFREQLAQIFLVLFDPEGPPSVKVPEAAAHDEDVDLGSAVSILERRQPLVQVLAPDASDEDVVQVDVLVLSEIR